MTEVSTPVRSTWHLANLAECASPYRPDRYGLTPAPASADPSSGARFLRRVEDGTREALDSWAAEQDPDDLAAMDPARWADEIDHDGRLHEVADGAVSIYTHDLWATFADVAAYDEDPSEYGDPDGQTMTALAGWCLYAIAQRLAVALVTEWAGEWIDAHQDNRVAEYVADGMRMAERREWAREVLAQLPTYPPDDATDADYRDYDEAKADAGEMAIDLLADLYADLNVRTTASGARIEGES